MDSPVRDYETPAARSNPVTVASASGERRGRPKVPTADYMFTAKERGDVRFTKNFNVTTGNGKRHLPTGSCVHRFGSTAVRFRCTFPGNSTEGL